MVGQRCVDNTIFQKGIHHYVNSKAGHNHICTCSRELHITAYISYVYIFKEKTSLFNLY